MRNLDAKSSIGVTHFLVRSAGVGVIVSGAIEVAMIARFHHHLPYRAAFIALGVMTILVVVLALVWPGATILVLAVLLGVRVFIEGLVLTMFGVGLRRFNNA